MLMEWLEPTIAKKVQQVSGENCQDKKVGEYLDQFIDIMTSLQNHVPEEIYLNKVMEMESLLSIICFLSEDLSYRKGLLDGMQLQQEIQKLDMPLTPKTVLNIK
jgi:hypothetical protein